MPNGLSKGRRAFSLDALVGFGQEYNSLTTSFATQFRAFPNALQQIGVEDSDIEGYGSMFAAFCVNASASRSQSH